MSIVTPWQDLPIHPFFKLVDVNDWDIKKFLTWGGHEHPIQRYQKGNLHRIYKDSLQTVLNSNPPQGLLAIITKFHNENFSVSMMHFIIIICRKDVNSTYSIELMSRSSGDRSHPKKLDLTRSCYHLDSLLENG